MDKVQESASIFAPRCSTTSCSEIGRSSKEYEIPFGWKNSTAERSTASSQQMRETRLVTTVSATTTRRSKNTNRSPRQVRRNERERGRKARLNAAFKVLRNVIPFYTDGLSKEKLTQVQVLRLAAKYIMTLSDILGSDESAESEDEIFSSQLQSYRMSYDLLSFASAQ
eukprot:gene12019-13259_t